MSAREAEVTADGLRLAPESIEALACRLAELLRPDDRQAGAPQRLISAATVAEWWGVDRRWVYDHADQLGARRLGAGKRPRLRFDPDDVAERIGTGVRRAPSHRRRLPSICGDPRSRSLSPRSRAILGEEPKQAAGRRGHAPGPAPKKVLRHGD
jgi:hypothetical protein